MYQSFSIVSIHQEYANKRIVVLASFDVDPSTVNESTIKVYSKNDKADVTTDFIVDNKTITILLKDEIVPNTGYVLRITDGVKSILGDSLDSGLRRTITFSSEVTQVPRIIAPANYQVTKSIDVELEVTNVKSNDVLYQIQIARDIAFINIDIDTTVSNPKTSLQSIDDGQYYIRARIEKSLDGKPELGQWSEVSTFILNKNLDQNIGGNNSNDNVNDGFPEYIEEVQVISRPENGETPNSIIIEFNEDISPGFLDSIVVVRRDV